MRKITADIEEIETQWVELVNSKGCDDRRIPETNVPALPCLHEGVVITEKSPLMKDPAMVFDEVRTRIRATRAHAHTNTYTYTSLCICLGLAKGRCMGRWSCTEGRHDHVLQR